MSPIVREAVVREYQQGMSMESVVRLHPELTHRQVRSLLSEVVRPRAKSPPLPSEEEIEREMQRFKSQWSAEEANLRWIGRSAPAALERGRNLSCLIFQ